MMKRLSTLLACLGVSHAPLAYDLPVFKITASSGEAAVGALFVCLPGQSTDGHLFAREAYERGARAFFCSRPVSLPADALVFLIPALSDRLFSLLSSFYDHPHQSLQLVGITGTKGKTTTAMILARLLSSAGRRVATVGTTGIRWDGGCYATVNTTPDLFVLFPLLSRFRAEGVDTVIMEVSSFALRDGRIRGLHIPFGAFTSFGLDHIGGAGHRDLAEYLAAKARLFAEYGMHTAAYVASCASAASAVGHLPHRLTVGIDSKEATLSVSIARRGEEGTVLLYREQPYRLSLPGDHHVTNALLAVALAAAVTGLSYDCFFPFLGDIRIPGRATAFTVAGRRVVLDFAHNGMSLAAVTSTLRQSTVGRVLLVYGSVGDREVGRRADLARHAEALGDFSVITADDWRREHPLCVAAQIYEAYQDKRRACIIVDRAEALRHAFRISAPGDSILCLGKGGEDFLLVHGKRVPFSEAAVLASLGTVEERL